MNIDSKGVIRGISQKLETVCLSARMKQVLKNTLSKPIYYVPDCRFGYSQELQEILNHDIHVLPGMSLSAEETEVLFLQLNYARFRMFEIQADLKGKNDWPLGELKEFLYWHHRHILARSKIVTGNMGLVLAMARHVSYYSVEFTDLVGEGNMALLRATDRFDCGRGFKFSTYACRAILKGFSRIARQSCRYRSLFPVQLDVHMEKSDYQSHLRQETYEGQVEDICHLFQSNLAELSDTEQSVVAMRFSLDHKKPKGMTLKEVGQRLGLSKERIRQIQNKAIQKLRLAAEEHMKEG